MGGQIMPPVMGAVAFIMAENIGVPYAEIVKAAIIPAILYFGSAFWMVHLEAGKLGLTGIPRAELPNPLTALMRGTGTWSCRSPCSSTCSSPATRRCSPASSGLALTVDR